MPNLILTFASDESSLSVSRFSVHEGISTLFTVTVWALSDDPGIDLDTIVGKDASFQVVTGAAFAPLGGARLWTGICEHMSLVKVEPTGKSTYHLRIVPTLWLLTQRRGHRIFQHLSIPTSWTRSSASGTSSRRGGSSATSTSRSSTRRSTARADYDFLLRLLEEAGIAFTFPYDEANGSQLTLDDALHAGAARAAPPIRYTDNPRGAPDKEVVTHVELGHDVRPGAHVIRDFDFRNPGFALLGKRPQGGSAGGSVRAVRVPAGRVPGGGRAAGRHGRGGRQGPLPLRPERRRRPRPAQPGGRAGPRSGRCRSRPTPSNSGPAWSCPSTSTLTRSSARPSSSPASSSTGRPGRSGTCPATRSSPPRPTARRPPQGSRASTPCRSARVVGPAGQEIHTDEFGRVRVQFPWDREGQSDDGSSIWMRVSQEWAGRGSG